MKEPERIVRYWHAVELLQPQSAPKRKNRDSHYGAYLHDTPFISPIPPWAPESIVSKQALPDKRAWSHTLYAYLYDSQLVAAALLELYGADQATVKGGSARHSCIRRTARSRTSDGNLFDFVMALSSQTLEPPQFTGRFLPEGSFDFQAYWSNIVNPVALGN